MDSVFDRNLLITNIFIIILLTIYTPSADTCACSKYPRTDTDTTDRTPDGAIKNQDFAYSLGGCVSSCVSEVRIARIETKLIL